MKNLRKIDVVLLVSRTKIKTEKDRNNTKSLKKDLALNRFIPYIRVALFLDARSSFPAKKAKYFC